MPNYDYICDNCQHTQEVFQSMKDAPLVECPHCHQSTFRRLIGTGAGIIFKGSGFYQTDYKRSNASTANEGGASSAPASPCGGGCACHVPKKAESSASTIKTVS